MKEKANDRLAHASVTPDVGALLEECLRAQNNQLCNFNAIKVNEAERYQLRDGKDGSGQLWQKNLADRAKIVRPYDGCPDPDVPLTDEICENEVDLDLTAHAMAQFGAMTVHLGQLSAAQVAELVAMARWVRQAITEDLDDAEELLAQMKATNGVAVLNPGWLEKYELVERTLDLESFVVQTAEAFGPEAARALQTAILDPSLEAVATSAIEEMFAWLPAQRARKIVRDLRTQGQAVFLDKMLAEKRPTVRTLIPGYNYFVSGSAGDIKKARLHLVIERMQQAELEAVAADRGWNKEFVAAAIGTAGQYSSLAEDMRQKKVTAEIETEDLSIEIWTTSVLQYDPELGAAGIYCTVFSPHVQPAAADPTTAQHFAEHYLCDYAHRCPPFVLARREVTGPGMFDSRGVPDITVGNAQAIRQLQKANLARAHLEVNPPRAFIGYGGTKVQDWNTPGASIPMSAGITDVKDLGPSRGNPAVAEANMERLARDTHRLFAFPDAEVHPARWQPRSLRKSRRALAPWRQCYTQLVVLCYQNLEEWELAQILGRPPLLKLEDVLHHRITLAFEPRALDNDWRKDTLETFVQLLQMDRGGLMDTGKLLRIIGSMTDPVLMDEIVQNPAGAQAALFDKVANTVMQIMAGNPPPLVEMDPTAEMQLRMAMQVIGQNPRYQEILRADAEVAENFKTYIKNLQHSNQETQISPVQGRLGVANEPQRPVASGAPQLGG